MEPIRRGQARFRIHGPTMDGENLVSASIFANKLTIFIRALREADRQVNGGSLIHDYKIAKLESSSPTVLISEVRIPRQAILHEASGINGFEDCADAIIASDSERAKRYGKCINYIGELAGGTPRTYGYGEVWTREDHFTRIDKFLAEQADEIARPAIVRPAEGEWFKGAVDASFDGAIKAVDLRGDLPELKLILSAGGKQLDCICHAIALETIKDNLDKRVRIYGRAIYDGKSGLPRRIEVRDIEPVETEFDFSRWRGSFEPFEPIDWDAEET